MNGQLYLREVFGHNGIFFLEKLFQWEVSKKLNWPERDSRNQNKKMSSRRKKIVIWLFGNIAVEVKILKTTRLINRELHSVFCKILWIKTLKSSFSATSSNMSIHFVPLLRNIAKYDSNCLLHFALLIGIACHFWNFTHEPQTSNSRLNFCRTFMC